MPSLLREAAAAMRDGAAVADDDAAAEMIDEAANLETMANLIEHLLDRKKLADVKNAACVVPFAL
jgi:hypothetical protein